jgi:hypothetical protein
MHIKNVHKILQSATEVAEIFREAREKNQLDHLKSLDAIEDLVYDLKNLKHLIQTGENVFRETKSRHIITFTEVKIGIDPENLSPDLLNSFLSDLSETFQISPRDIYFLGYRFGSTELLLAIEGKQPVIPDDYSNKLAQYKLEHVRPWEKIPDKLTFISCSDEDIATGKDILRFLTKENFEPWLEQESIWIGERIPSAITKAFEKSTGFVFCFSKSSINPQRLYKWEFLHAVMKAEQDYKDGLYLFPVRIGTCETPDEIKEYRVLDWEDGKNWSKLLGALWEGLRRRKNARYDAVFAGQPGLPLGLAGDHQGSGTGQ